MKNMKTLKIYSLLFTVSLSILSITSCTKEDSQKVSSPDKNIQLSAGIKDGKMYYTVSRKETEVIDTSFLGLTLKEGYLGENLKIKKIEHSSFNETWHQPWGEESSIENKYNQMIVDVEESEEPKRNFSVVFRVFNDGIGFRYVIPEQPNLKEFTIMDEQTEFALPEDAIAWSIPWDTEYYEGLFKPSLVSRLDTVCTPLTMKVNEKLYLTIHEANLTDYASLNLTPKRNTTTLKAFLTPWSTGEKVFANTPMQTPWRTIIIADKPGDLILSRLMLNLNEPCKIEDTSWIQPGRYIGIWWGMHMKKQTWEQGPKHGATTENTMNYIDFAAKHGFSGVLVEGWNYGWDGDWSANGDQFSFTKAYPDFDLEKITSYAASKGVRLIGHNETGGAAQNYEAQLDSAFALYQKYGINAVKTGYVNPLLDHKELHGSQYGVRHYRKVIETAAKYNIMIDNHEPVMPTGLQRTYPNLMTQEGVRGQEYDAWSADGGNPPEHTTTIPFTRGLAGPMDFTPGTFNFNNPVHPQTHPQTTLAKQLALAVVLYSPLQMASDMIENYENNPAFDFITSCPTNWAKTVVPEAKIGEYVTIARKDRDSENWFIGSITNASPREVNLPLSFLDANASYKAHIFADGEEANYKNNPYPVTITEENVNSSTVLTLKQAPGGGTAIMIIKE